MTALIILGLAVAAGIIATLVLVARAARHGLRRHPLPKLAWRWLTGLPWDGKDPVPDATWFHRGSEEANVNGRRIRASTTGPGSRGRGSGWVRPPPRG